MAGLVFAIALVFGAFTASAPAVPQAAPRSTSPPTIEGEFREGQTLRAGNGIWANNPTSFTYQWQRCDSTGLTNCRNIQGATNQRYELRQADVGRTMRVLVTARNADGSTTANSTQSEVVAEDAAPRNTALPTITGTPTVGEELTATRGTWSGAPDSYRFQWLRCDTAGNNCTNVAGATSRTYGVRSADVGRTLRVRVTATNNRGAASATSAPTAVIRSGGATPPPATGNAVNIAAVTLPNRLVITGVAFEPRVLSSTAPFVARFRVTERSGRPVSGALVYAIALPYGLIRPAGEVQTGADGWASIVFRPTANLPRSGSIQMFVRARKPGDSLLGGVSTRRLVQVLVRR
jgi:hypothetical protein